jgi:hypothetical protein
VGFGDIIYVRSVGWRIVVSLVRERIMIRGVRRELFRAAEYS